MPKKYYLTHKNESMHFLWIVLPSPGLFTRGVRSANYLELQKRSSDIQKRAPAKIWGSDTPLTPPGTKPSLRCSVSFLLGGRIIHTTSAPHFFRAPENSSKTQCLIQTTNRFLLYEMSGLWVVSISIKNSSAQIKNFRNFPTRKPLVYTEWRGWTRNGIFG